MTTQPDDDSILALLNTGAVTLRGQFQWGSNYTFLVQAGDLPAVYKPSRGERPLYDFPARSLAKREAAAYLVSRALGWNLAPPTVYRSRGLPLGAGSLQQFIDHDPNDHYFNFSPEDRERLRPTALFDLLINNADRKGSHILRDADGRFWLIDHGICFHTEDKLRTVIWNFAGQPIPPDLLADVQRFAAALAENPQAVPGLSKLLKPAEIRALLRRAQNLLEHPVYPIPDERKRYFPYPPI